MRVFITRTCFRDVPFGIRTLPFLRDDAFFFVYCGLPRTGDSDQRQRLVKYVCFSLNSSDILTSSHYFHQVKEIRIITLILTNK